MQATRELFIDAAPENVWQILGPEFEHVDRWARSVRRSDPRSGAASLLARSCEPDLGPFRDAIVEYDEDMRAVAYEASVEKAPFFVRRLVTRWVVGNGPDGTTHLVLLMSARFSFPFNVLIWPVMRILLERVLSDAVEELKHYAETGEPHPRRFNAMPRLG